MSLGLKMKNNSKLDKNLNSYKSECLNINYSY
jgi:hypothetical protein